MIIPDEARRMIEAYREGKTEAQFISYMWVRRMAENPGKRKSTGRWPIQRSSLPSNVTPIRKKKPA